MKPQHLEDDDDEGFLRRNLAVIIVLGALALGGGGYLYAQNHPAKEAKTRVAGMVVVIPIEEEKVREEPVLPEETQPKELPEEKAEQQPSEIEPPPAAAEKVESEPAESLGTAIAGSDGSGLYVGGHDGVIGGRPGIAGQTYSERGRWQGRLSRAVQEVLARNEELKNTKGSVIFRMWLDSSGRVTRVTLNSTTGDSRQDEVLRSQALVGQMLEPAPAGTPMPVILRFNGL